MKRIFILLSCFFVFSSMKIDAQSFQWAKQLASRVSYGTNVATDNYLNVISTGWFYDSIDMDPGPGVAWRYGGNSNSYHSYISKLGPNGTLFFGNTYSSSGYNRITALDVDALDNIIVMGHFRDSIDLDFGPSTFMLYDNNFNSSAYDNIFIAKYDPGGVFIWGKLLQHSNGTINYSGLWGHDLKIDHNDDIILTGRFRDTVDFDPGFGVFNVVSSNTSTSSSYWDKFLLKLNSAGNFVWVRNWAHSGWANSGWYGSHELDVDSSNNIFFPLVYFDSLDVDPQLPVSMVYTQGLHDVSLLKMTPAGTLIWHKEVGGVGQEYCHSLATDRWGNIFYSIQSYSNPFDADPGPGQHMITWTGNQWGKIILKLDNNGDFIWALQNLQNNYNSSWYGEGMATDTLGGLYLTTRIWQNNVNNNQWDLDPGPGAYIVSSAGSSDIAFQNLDSSGKFIWGGAMGGPVADWSYGLCTDNARGVYLTGVFNQTADLNPTPATDYLTNTPTGYDAFVVKLKNCNTATSEIVQNCDSVWYNNQLYFRDTIFQNHYTAANGCDSAHSIVIDVKTLTDDTLIVDTCKFYIWDNTTYTSTGFYTQNFGIPGGCDSVVTLDLTIRTAVVQPISLSDCDSASYNGVFYSQTGQYQQVYYSPYGCDSNFIITFTKTTPDTSISLNGTTGLIANAISATYQWIDCATMQPIVGATSAFFTASAPGNYACIVTQNGCSDTSGCHAINFVPDAVNEYSILSRLYPNPSSGNCQLELDKNYQDVQLEVRTINGQLIWQKQYGQLQKTMIDLGETSGVYMLYIKQGGRTQVKKLMKW